MLCIHYKDVPLYPVGYVVQEFVDTHNFAKVYRLQKGILTDYMDDIAKYAEGAEKTKAGACFLSIPKHLATAEKATSKSMTSIIQNYGAWD